MTGFCLTGLFPYSHIFDQAHLHDEIFISAPIFKLKNPKFKIKKAHFVDYTLQILLNLHVKRFKYT